MAERMHHGPACLSVSAVKSQVQIIANDQTICSDYMLKGTQNVF